MLASDKSYYPCDWAQSEVKTKVGHNWATVEFKDAAGNLVFKWVRTFDGDGDPLTFKKYLRDGNKWVLTT